ncbi:MAG: DUF1573 domain-containing protein [Planctomycetota bacterium]
MKIAILGLVATIVGVSIGSSLAYVSYSNPGPDFKQLTQIEEDANFDSFDAPKVKPKEVAQAIEVLGGEDFDFGVMDRGETRTHSFTLKNNSDKTVTVEVKGTTCKCTVGDLEKSSIGPNETVDVNLEWVAKSSETEFKQTATIVTSHPAKPTILLNVYGKVLHIVQAFPANIAFSDVTVRESREQDFAVFGFKDDRLVIDEHRWSEPELEKYFEFEWRTAPQETVESHPDAKAAVICKIKMKEGMPLGPVSQTLELVTSSSRSGVLDIPIRARIVGDVSLTGSGYRDQTNILRLGPIARDRGLKKKLYLTVKGPHREEFEITAAKTDPEDVLLVEYGEPRELQGGRVKMYTIQFEVPPKARPVNYTGGEEHDNARAVFTTTHPDLKEIEVLVNFAVTE